MAVLFVLTVTAAAGLPGFGDAALIGAGVASGEGRLTLSLVLAVAVVAWMLGSVLGYAIGRHVGRRLLDHPGFMERYRRRTLAKGDQMFKRHGFLASVILPAYVSGVFRVRPYVFLVAAGAAGVFYIGLYVVGGYFVGPELVEHLGGTASRWIFGLVIIVAVVLIIRALLSRLRRRRRVKAK